MTMKGHYHSEETKQKIKEAKRKNPQYVSLETRKKISEGNKGKHPTDEQKYKAAQNRKEAMKKKYGFRWFWIRIEIEINIKKEKTKTRLVSTLTRQKISKANKGNKGRTGLHFSEETKQKMRHPHKSYNGHSWRKGTKGLVKLWNEGLINEIDPRLLKVSLAHKGKSSWCKGLTKETNIGIANRAKKMKTLKRSEEWKQRISKSKKICWENLTKDQQHQKIRKLLSTRAKSPNKSELSILEIAESFKFKYNGRGPIKIQNQFQELWENLAMKKRRYGFIPDFVNIQHNLLIEYDGYHDPKMPGVPQNKPELDNIRNQTYIASGWKLLILTPEDLREGPEYIRTKIEQFVNSNQIKCIINGETQTC